jgi:hypothetical protein
VGTELYRCAGVHHDVRDWISSLWGLSCVAVLAFQRITPSSSCRTLLLVSCLTYISTLKLDAICSSETSAFLRTTQHYNPKARVLDRLVVFEKKVLRKTFDPMKGEVAVGCKKAFHVFTNHYYFYFFLRALKRFVVHGLL